MNKIKHNDNEAHTKNKILYTCNDEKGSWREGTQFKPFPLITSSSLV